MTRAAREALIQAALDGVPQLIGRLFDGRGGYCALGVLEKLSDEQTGLSTPVNACPICGATEETYHNGYEIRNEGALLVHYNNDHLFDFLTCANKMPVSEEAADA